MAKTTVLDIVQMILSKADGDNVNSISDTIESEQAAECVQDAFNQIVEAWDLKLHDRVDQLNATSASTPALMTRPENFKDIEWIKYDKRTAAGDDPSFQDVTYLEPYDFFTKTSQRNVSNSNVETMTLPLSGTLVRILNDRAPQYWSILEGYNSIVFDAYDSNLETNLQASKSAAWGSQLPELALADATEPDLPEHLMILLKREAEAMYFDLYKEGVPRDMDRFRRQASVRAQRKRRVTKQISDAEGLPDYGRK